MYKCDILKLYGRVVLAQNWFNTLVSMRTDVKLLVILPVFLIATLALSVTPVEAWWQFVVNGPNGERQISPHFETEMECKRVLKVTEAELAKKYPDRYPLVGSCEQYR